MREQTVKVIVENRGREYTISARRGRRLSDVLLENGFALETVCGGSGNCGKCKVHFMTQAPAVTNADCKKLMSGELQNGERLACMVLLQSDCRVELLDFAETGKFLIPDVMGSKTEKTQRKSSEDQGGHYGIGIDIGTTTLAAALIRIGENNQFAGKEVSLKKVCDRILAAETGLNHQRRYGADVISRIQAAQSGLADELRKSITEDITELIRLLLDKNEILPKRLEHITIAGNTTMLHLLRGYSCDDLGKYPYKAVSLKLEEHAVKEVFPQLSEVPDTCRITILPGFSAFVGADILSGLYALDTEFREKKNKILFLDLGTNGEMAVRTGQNMMVTSTAAGPVFEGGEISRGTGSIPGAIAHVHITAEGCSISTIGNATPCGICGTGVMEAAAALYKAGIADETGLLAEPYFQKGYPLYTDKNGQKIFFTQQDIRKVQLGKAAIRAGIEILLKKAGIETKQITQVYIAGGFGSQVDFEAIRQLDLLPNTLLSDTKIVGNTSLYGTLRFMLVQNAKEEVNMLAECVYEIALAQNPEFEEQYVAHMNFESEDAHEL